MARAAAAKSRRLYSTRCCTPTLRNPHDAKLLVGNTSRDDAAVYDIGGGQAVISTTDFFMPIVDDAYDFGRIASANAISDVYAMGGRPLLAIAVLGWPVDKLPPEVARRVLEGARSICAEAGIPLAGGHSIDSPEPIFGLAVTGLVPEVHPAGMFLLIAFLATSMVFRKSFCSWLCPIGTLSEWLWIGGRDLFGRNLALPRWADVPLCSLKYIFISNISLPCRMQPTIVIRICKYLYVNCSNRKF